jgi:hypothetical protein
MVVARGVFGLALIYCTMATTTDEVLDILHRTGPEFGGGLANHGPMAAEAMWALGRPDAVLPWVERYKSRLQDCPAHSQPIAREAWRDALGHINRKFTEACLREYVLHPQAVYLVAARDVVERVGGAF